MNAVLRGLLQTLIAVLVLFAAHDARAQSAGVYIFQPIQGCSNQEDQMGGRCQLLFNNAIDHRLGGSWTTLNEEAVVYIMYYLPDGTRMRAEVTIVNGAAVVTRDVVESPTTNWDQFVQWLGDVLFGENGTDLNGDGNSNGSITVDGGTSDPTAPPVTPPAHTHY